LIINDDVLGDIKTESRMDIGELKKEISDIIDEECVVSVCIMMFGMLFIIIIIFKGH